MTGLILITGTIYEAMDLHYRLDPSMLYYTSWYEDPDNPKLAVPTTEEVPIVQGGKSFDIVQSKGSGKTLYAMQILSQRAYYGFNVAANLPLYWHNMDNPDKDTWKAVINNFNDFRNASHTTNLIDDVKETIEKWNTSAADILTEISGGGRKEGRTDIYTAQREKQIPPEIRDQATEWIVPIIRERDFTQPNPSGDDTGIPLEMIALHFDGAKVFKYFSLPIRNLENLFDCYSTTARAINLKDEGNSAARPTQHGWQAEEDLCQWLQKNVPEETWVHLNDSIFDVKSESNRYAFDFKGINDDGMVHLDHNKDLISHIMLAKSKGHEAYLVIKDDIGYGWIRITYALNEKVKGKKIHLKHLNKSLIRAKTLFKQIRNG